MRYDAYEQPNPGAWLGLGEDERIALVVDYHRREKMKLERPELHAITHVMVENHLALGGETPAPATLGRLLDEGLDRHEAIHAIGGVLLNIMLGMAKEDAEDFNTRYTRELAALSAASWRPPAD
jgi:hypothetical protein